MSSQSLIVYTICHSAQSVLSVLGRSTLAQNIVRLEMRIEDPSRELKGRRPGQGRVVDNDGVSEDDVQTNSRESRLILKLVCKHGKCFI